MTGLPSLTNNVPSLDPSQYNAGGQEYHPDSSMLRGAGDRSRGSGSTSGGGAIRNRSGERRYDSSPYSDRSYYSSSLVTSYLSPPPESRWRRTSSDSALYQKLTQPASPNQKSPSEQGSPEYSPAS